MGEVRPVTRPAVATWAESMYRNEMLRAERVLADIRVRLKFAGDAELAAWSRVDSWLLVGTVETVLTLHRPGARGRCRVCARRRPYLGGPCVTVRTVSRCLDQPAAPPRSGTGAGDRAEGEGVGDAG